MEVFTVPTPGTAEHDDFFDSFLFHNILAGHGQTQGESGEVTAQTREDLPPAKSVDMLEALLDTPEEENSFASAFERQHSSARYAAEEASHHAECAVCFEPLCQGKAVVFIDSSRQRICRHYFHEPCVKDLRPDNSHIFRCPLCRTPFSVVLRMPDPRVDPKQWFKLASTDANETLTLQEVKEVLLATVNTDCELLDAVVNNKWKEWDKDNKGYIEWCNADGLFDFVRMNLPGRRQKPPPDLARDRGAWFEFFDHTAAGYLTEGAVARGIIKSFPAHNSATQLAQMVREVFGLFATKGDAVASPLRSAFASRPAISKEDFLKEDGLADAVISALHYEGIPLSSYQDEEDKAIAEELQQAFLVGNEVFSAEEWECVVCTFLNKATETACGMCQTKRPKRKNSGGGVDCGQEEETVETAEVTVAQVEVEQSVGWACEVCTLLNAEEVTFCGACNTPRYGRRQRRATEGASSRNEPPERERRRRSHIMGGTSRAAVTPPPPSSSRAPAVHPLFPPESQWEPDSGSTKCRSCNASFTFFLRRHHCRGCGRLFCTDCAPPRPSSRTISQTERICRACAVLIE
eukprot:TRINITY_DN2163_c0_g1_i11.p1 TRINITY_DN2163_c0_g1~~TRINITY_DN2163_c0_g1_i11.p1  ORF type:complete len:577 (+),score=60.97 TRINITY_DN2163_c0_g1_i11:64-1794(+)